jgi:hypothetical protein
VTLWRLLAPWGALALAALYGLPGRAHGDAAWIMENPGFVTKSGIHCCGPSDCRRMTEEEVARVRHLKGGFEVDGVFFAEEERGLYRSYDGDWWWCVMVTPKCLFPPPEGT